MEPFGLVLFAQNLINPTTQIAATSEPVPEGKLFVIEHISGFFDTKGGNTVELIVAIGVLMEQEVYLPEHFAGGISGGFPPVVASTQRHQFGSPVKMYVPAGQTITLQCDAQVSITIRAIVMGHLIKL